jgi:hypothetical protein
MMGEVFERSAVVDSLTVYPYTLKVATKKVIATKFAIK